MFMYEPIRISKEFLETDLRNIFGAESNSPQKEIGVEVELEGFGCYVLESLAANESKWWTPHKDPSLRGEAVELVLSKPASWKEFFDKALPEYKMLLEASGFKPAMSRRCSLHVHLDFSHKSFYTFAKFMTLYALVEEYFFEAVGKERRGNQFCLSLSEARGFVANLVTAIRNNQLNFVDENQRYMACNLHALRKFGSVEIRLHEGAYEHDKIGRWVHVLYDMMKYAQRNFDHTPSQYLEQVSMAGLDAFLRKNLPRTWDLIKDVYHKVQGRNNIDAAQDIGYACSWVNAPKEMPVKAPVPLKPAPPAPYHEF